MRAWSRRLVLGALVGATGVVTAYGLWAALLIALRGPGPALLVVALGAFCVLAWLLRFSAGSTEVTVSALVVYLSIALLGTLPAIGVDFLGIVAVAVSLRAMPWKRRFGPLAINAGVHAGATLAAGSLFSLIAGHGQPAALASRVVMGYLCMSSTYTVVNLGLLALVRRLLTNTRAWASFVGSLHQFWINGVLFAFAGLLSQALYQDLGFYALVLIFGSLLAVRFTFQQYAANQRTRSEMAGVLAQALSFKDAYTGEHSLRVASLSVGIGRQVGLGEAQLEKLRDGALLHDIGKVAVPDAVLGKPGPLDLNEKRHMDRHVGAGGDLLEQSTHLRELAGFVRAHHALAGNEAQPPLFSRIIAVADAYDAMTSDRPYRRALPLAEAVRRLREGAGTQFDAGLVEALLRDLRAQGLPVPSIPAGTPKPTPTAVGQPHA